LVAMTLEVSQSLTPLLTITSFHQVSSVAEEIFNGR
jgi:hypothetical protein